MIAKIRNTINNIILKEHYCLQRYDSRYFKIVICKNIILLIHVPKCDVKILLYF